MPKRTRENDEKNLDEKSSKVARGEGVILDPSPHSCKKYQKSAWVFTSWEDCPVKYDNEWMKYLCFQWEICPNTGKKHQQGYLECLKKTTMNGIKKRLGNKKIHLEPREGTQVQAIDYCKKPKPAEVQKYPSDCYKFQEFGKKAEPGKRTDMAYYIQMIKEGRDEWELANNPDTVDIWARYPGVYKRYKQLEQKQKPKPMPNVVVICGPSGAGKSRAAHLIGKNLGKVYTMTGNYKWWEDYNSEETVIMDDYDGQMPHRELLQLWDRYKCKRETKGGHVYVTSPNFIVTCNNIEWTKAEGVDRRINRIIQL